MVTLGVFNEKSVTGNDWEYIIPQRRVMNFEDMKTWEKTEAYFEYLGFITLLNNAVEGTSSKSGYLKSERVKAILTLLDTIDTWADEIRPIEQPQRFGNKAFRTWIDRLKSEAFDLLNDGMKVGPRQSVQEIKEYLIESFGNQTRIDYGTGHEMAFCMFLCCLFKVGALLPEDKVAVVNDIFSRYLEVVRKLQITYHMEPAGSRGVWALDDFQFVPFIWGSSQLIDHPTIEPRMFVQQDIIDRYSEEFMFMRCLQYITQVKTGPFAEHSNQLWNISGVPSWRKVNQGLLKMYKAEVLSKFPVVQHVLFGSLLKYQEAKPISPNPHLIPSRTSLPTGPVHGCTTAPSSESSVCPSVSEGVKLPDIHK